MFFRSLTLAVPPKSKSRKRARSPEKPLSGLDVSSLLSSSRPQRKITRENAIPEYKQLLSVAEGAADIHAASQELGTVIASYVKNSLGDSGYDRAIEALRVCREETIELEEPTAYNTVLLNLKNKLLDGDLGPERTEWWWRVRMNRLGLIDKKESSFSDVDTEDARKVREALVLAADLLTFCLADDAHAVTLHSRNCLYTVS